MLLDRTDDEVVENDLDLSDLDTPDLSEDLATPDLDDLDLVHPDLEDLDLPNTGLGQSDRGSSQAPASKDVDARITK